MMIAYEIPISVYEYMPNKLVVHLDPTELLLIDSWQPMRLIKDVDPGNIYKFDIKRHPLFHPVKFPILICSGFTNYSFLNVNDFNLQPFIANKCPNFGAQQAFWFQQETYGHSMHFAAIDVTDDNLEHHQWYHMQMKTDFQIRVEAYGFLPNSTLTNKFATMKEI